MPQRAYRLARRCPHCGSKGMPQYGTSRGKPTYRCGDCKHRYPPEGNRPYHPETVKGQAVAMYWEGSSISAIGRALAARLEMVSSWIKKAAQARATLELVREQPAAAWPAGLVAVVISLNEAWTCLGCRNGSGRQELGIWTAVVADAEGRWWRDFEVGPRDEATFLRLYARLPEAVKYSTDQYGVYNGLPTNRREARQGRETHRQEGLHSALWGKLNRLARKAKGYTKVKEMRIGSGALLGLRQGWI